MTLESTGSTGAWQRKLLWVDGLGGAAVGVLVLLLGGWLSELYRLPRDLVFLMGWANLAYGTCSTTLASRSHRPMALIVLLVVANLTWAVLCFRWTALHHEAASVFGFLHLLGEGVYVGGLACLEWRWRESLREA